MWTVTIYLRMQLPVFFSDPPGSQKRTGQFVGCRKDQVIRFSSPCSPIWPCSQWGLPCQSGYPKLRCALTAPFHPYRYPLTLSCRGERDIGPAVFFLWHFPCPHGRWVLPITVSCGARTFLSSAGRIGNYRTVHCKVSTQLTGTPLQLTHSDASVPNSGHPVHFNHHYHSLQPFNNQLGSCEFDVFFLIGYRQSMEVNSFSGSVARAESVEY